MHARDMYAYERHAHKRCPYGIHTYEMHAYDTCPRERHSYKRYASLPFFSGARVARNLFIGYLRTFLDFWNLGFGPFCHSTPPYWARDSVLSALTTLVHLLKYTAQPIPVLNILLLLSTRLGELSLQMSSHPTFQRCRNLDTSFVARVGHHLRPVITQR